MKRIFSLFFLIILLTSVSSAISTDLKENYSPGETAIVKISGNILEPIMPKQVIFKRNNVAVPFEYDLKKLDTDYYLWFITPLDSLGINYTLNINDISTTNLGKVEKVDHVQNFSITGETSEYNVKPGFIFSREEFDIQVELNKDSEIEIGTNFPSSTTLTIKPGKNNIHFPINSVKITELKLVKLGKYNIPAYIIVNKSSEVLRKKNNTLVLTPDSITSLRLKSDKKISYNIKIKNNGHNIIESLYIESNNDDIEITPSKKIDLEADEEREYNLTISSTEKDISENIQIKSEENNISIELPIHIEFVDNFTSVRIENSSLDENNTEGFYCVELEGRLCPSSTKCDGKLTDSLDGSCCLGECTTVNNQRSNAWIGYLIAGIMILVIVFIYIKYKKVKPAKTVLEKTIGDEKNKRAITP